MNMRRDPLLLLQKELTAIGLPIENTLPKFEKFLFELQKWNKIFNLTAITATENIITHHFLDSLSTGQFLQGERILDVGTGAGFPGIPLAICYPTKKFFLLDSNGKKIRFLLQIKALLQLDNVEILETRIEKFFPTQLFDTVVSRAFSSLKNFVQQTHRLCAPHGIMLAMKGELPEQELQEIKQEPFKIISQSIHISELAAQRHIIVIKPTGDEL